MCAVRAARLSMAQKITQVQNLIKLLWGETARNSLYSNSFILQCQDPRILYLHRSSCCRGAVLFVTYHNSLNNVLYIHMQTTT